MSRASRGFGDCHVQRTQGTRAQCLWLSVPRHHPLHPSSLLLRREPRGGPGAARSSYPILLLSPCPTQGRGTGCKLPSSLLLRTGFLLVEGRSSWRRGKRLLAPDVWGCTGDITLQSDTQGKGVTTEGIWSNFEGGEFGHSTLLLQGL